MKTKFVTSSTTAGMVKKVTMTLKESVKTTLDVISKRNSYHTATGRR